MEMPSLEEIMAAMASPQVPTESVEKMEDASEIPDAEASEMEMHAMMLLDILKTVTRMEVKIDEALAGNRNAVAPDPGMLGVPSQQLDLYF